MAKDEHAKGGEKPTEKEEERSQKSTSALLKRAAAEGGTTGMWQSMWAVLLCSHLAGKGKRARKVDEDSYESFWVRVLRP